MRALLRHDIAEVIIEFDGAGDEGQIERIRCTRLDGSEGSLEFPSDIPGTMIPAGTRVWNSQARQYVTQPTDRPAAMAHVLDEWGYELLDATGVDWVNNEGGFGAIVISPAENAIRCDMNQRFVAIASSQHEL